MFNSNGLDDMSLILTKARMRGFFESVKPEEKNYLTTEANRYFSEDIFFGKENVFDVTKFGAVGDKVTDDTAVIQAVIDRAPEHSIIQLPKEHYIATYLTCNTRFVTFIGPGSIYGGKLRIGTTGARQDLYSSVVGLTFEAAGDKVASTYGLEFLKARAFTVTQCTFIGHDKAIYINPLSDAILHDTSMLHIDDNRFANCNYALYADRDNAATWMHFADSHFTNNTVNLAYITHVWLKSVDGFHCLGNTFFFPAYTLSSSIKTNNIYIGQSSWIFIKDNNLFEAGFESILLDQASRFVIANNQIAWPGQRQPSDGIKLTGSNTLNGTIADNIISKMSGDGISVFVTGPGTIAVKENMVEYDATTPTYYGSPALNTFTHYGINQDVNSTVNLFEHGNDMTGGLYSNRKGSLHSSFRLTNDSSATASKVAVTVSGISPIFTLNSQRYGQLTFSGLITLEAKSADTENSNLAVYTLSVAKTSAGTYYITQITALGLLAGSSANWPSFTWTIDSGTGRLMATPVGSTSGLFYFYATALGNLRLI